MVPPHYHRNIRVRSKCQEVSLPHVVFADPRERGCVAQPTLARLRTQICKARPTCCGIVPSRFMVPLSCFHGISWSFQFSRTSMYCWSICSARTTLFYCMSLMQYCEGVFPSLSVTVRKTAWASVCGIINQSVFYLPTLRYKR